MNLKQEIELLEHIIKKFKQWMKKPNTGRVYLCTKFEQEFYIENLVENMADWAEKNIDGFSYDEAFLYGDTHMDSNEYKKNKLDHLKAYLKHVKRKQIKQEIKLLKKIQNIIEARLSRGKAQRKVYICIDFTGASGVKKLVRDLGGWGDKNIDGFFYNKAFTYGHEHLNAKEYNKRKLEHVKKYRKHLKKLIK